MSVRNPTGSCGGQDGHPLDAPCKKPRLLAVEGPGTGQGRRKFVEGDFRGRRVEESSQVVFRPKMQIEEGTFLGRQTASLN